jgi:hypothetical protein
MATTNASSTVSETDEHLAYAVLFTNDLSTNNALRAEWKAKLKAVKANASLTFDVKLEVLDNFLADQGYDTTAKAVLALIKEPFYQAEMKKRRANAASDRFVQDLMTNAQLYHTYMGEVQSAQKAGNTQNLDGWLVQQGYDCTAAQVIASFNNMRNHNMNYWTGTYGQTTVTGADGKAVSGPTLIIYGDTSATLGPDELIQFKYGKGQLSWGTEDGLNACSGKLTFSQVRKPNQKGAYVGNEFTGTLTYPATGTPPLQGEVAFTGRIGALPANRPGHISYPPSHEQKIPFIDQVFTWLNRIVLVGFAIELFQKFRGAGGETKSVGEVAESQPNSKLDEWDGQLEEITEESQGDITTINTPPSDAGDAAFTESTEVQQLAKESGGVPDPEELQEIETEEEAYDEEIEGENDLGGDAEAGDSNAAEDLVEIVGDI